MTSQPNHPKKRKSLTYGPWATCNEMRFNKNNAFYLMDTLRTGNQHESTVAKLNKKVCTMWNHKRRFQGGTVVGALCLLNPQSRVVEAGFQAIRDRSSGKQTRHLAHAERLPYHFLKGGLRRKHESSSWLVGLFEHLIRQS